MDATASDRLIVDLDLARRLERAEGAANAACVEARRETNPSLGAAWTEIAGTLAMFDGVGSPLTQTFGLGTAGVPTSAELDELEDFFVSRGSEVFHEVCPLIDQDFHRSLSGRGYAPLEWSDVMIRPLQHLDDLGFEPNPEIAIRLIGSHETETWAQLATRGWDQFPELADFMLATSRMLASRRGSLSFVADWRGESIATGSLFAHEGLALLAGASTVPEARRRGAQRALFAGRLRYAQEIGCTLAVVVAQPGSSSHRNAQSSGFRVAYTRTKWRKPLPAH